MNNQTDLWKYVSITIIISLITTSLLKQSQAALIDDNDGDDLPTFKCVMKGDHWCVLEKINLTKQSYNFQALAADALAIKDVQLQCTSLPVLSASICNQFPMVEGFWAINCGIETVLDDAFENCSKLQVVSLHDNRITKLPETLFSANPDLEHLYISKNHLTTLPDRLLSNLKKLRRLDMDHNHLTEFDAAILLRDLGNLEYFEIFSNRLLDLNATAVIQLVPRLKEIWIGDNDFTCERLSELLNEFTEHRIQVRTYVMSPEKRKRPYRTDTLNNSTTNLECLSSEQWIHEAKIAVEIKNRLHQMNVGIDDVDGDDDGDGDDETFSENSETETIVFEFNSGSCKVFQKILLLMPITWILITTTEPKQINLQ